MPLYFTYKVKITLLEKSKSFFLDCLNAIINKTEHMLNLYNYRIFFEKQSQIFSLFNLSDIGDENFVNLN
jgi:hypothetical protein